MPALPTNKLIVSVAQVRLLGLDVLNWRYECLEDAGYPADAAITLAERGDVDLHEACALLRAGASASEALRILL
jgi:hypothetical protein